MLIGASKGSEANKALKIATESLRKLKVEILILEQQANETTGKIMKVEYIGKAFGGWYSNIGNHFTETKLYSDNSPIVIAIRARIYLKSLYIPAVKTHKENILAIENNKALEKKIRLMMSNIGVPFQYSTSDYKTSRSQKKTKTTHNAGFVEDIQQLIKTSDGFGKIKSGFVKRWHDVNAYLKEERNKEKVIQQEKEKKIASENAEKQRAVLTIKYELPYESKWSDILEIILSKDKYLALAHALAMNRNDWNNGYWYAENGLSNFIVKTTENKKINNDIQGCIDNWDNDGRIFRDTEYNYDRIFGMVEESLMKDYYLAYNNCPS